MRGKHSNHARASRAGRWNNGKIIGSNGYVKVRVGRSHPLADPNGYCYEHKLIAVPAWGPLKPGEIIHHKNGDKVDNRLENLEVVSRAAHNKHRNEVDRERDDAGRFVGKKRAGRLLDGVEWNQFPEVKP